MEKRKYVLTNIAISLKGHTLYRIKAVQDFADIKAFTLGGFIESEDNLSQKGNCWVYDNSCVYGDAKVCGSSIISDESSVFGKALVKDSTVKSNSEVYGNAIVHNSHIKGGSSVCESAYVNGINVAGGASIKSNITIHGPATIVGKVTIRSEKDYIVFKNWWGSGRYFTWTRPNNMWSVGCFYGTGEQLVKKAYKQSVKDGDEYRRVVNYVNSILRVAKMRKLEENLKKGANILSHIMILGGALTLIILLLRESYIALGIIGFLVVLSCIIILTGLCLHSSLNKDNEDKRIF